MSTQDQFPQPYSALVIGAGAGIGAATASLLAGRGVAVTVADRDADAAETVAREIREAGGTAHGVAADVTDEASVRAAVDAAVARDGALHAVVNSAGIQGPLGTPSHEVEVADFERTLAVNLTAGLVIARAVVPHFLERGYGRIAHVASIAGKEGNPNMIGYSASKAGLIGMVKAQGKEYASHGITVNAVAPAVIRTPFLDTQPQDVLDYMFAKIPMGRAGTVDEVAEMLAFMVSPACSFTTGFTFDLSGGRATY
ncbi:3-oxoacyl-ACP reductase [Paraoerskovia sediminicola]|uniref:3-oxoacyl-ACP reductase n=1 Tax=Paraoerskovia sediminicola TaxID=1138587 RepID=A0ABM8G1Q2_9CELL|nr:SDR family NAD(P)-dependent oxidoreductase [Paraoerskovia sediminicola]BDZ41947.1 3-oxoacyl-ACP reductase [Paraoerskovia sediminicola]